MLEQQGAGDGLAADLVEEGTKDTFAVWQSAYEAYATYLGELAASKGPYDLMVANVRLMAANANIFTSAAGAILQGAGVREPTLSDA